MKELDNLMEALKKRDIPKKFRFAAKLAGYPKDAKDDEEAQKILDGATKHALCNAFDNDDELFNLFGDYSFELGMNALIKELDIKVPEKGTESKIGEVLKKLIDEIFE